METKHTPAPWSVARNASNGWIRVSALDGCAAVANVRAKKDARLIAAAPDLLAALQRLVRQHGSDGVVYSGGHPIAVARAAIALATGAAAQQPPVRIPQPRMIERKCAWCKGPFMARAVDVKRGWGKFCSKSCKASKQEKRTGQYRAISQEDRGEFSDAHLFSNEEHDCNKD